MNEQPQEKIKSPIDIFREEIKAWIDEQNEKKRLWEVRGKTGETWDPHAEKINPEYLTDDDRLIWEAIAQQTVTEDQWEKYIQKTREDLADASEGVKASRGTFSQFAGNEAQQVFYKDLLG